MQVMNADDLGADGTILVDKYSLTRSLYASLTSSPEHGIRLTVAGRRIGSDEVEEVDVAFTKEAAQRLGRSLTSYGES